MQRLWIERVSWDEPLPSNLADLFYKFQNQLGSLNRISVPRWTRQSGSSLRVQLHGFSDASNSAYSAVIFLRVETESAPIEVTMLYAKTKVAPVKLLSVPRLELCGALLLVKALTFVQTAMKLSDAPTFCWSDSTTVLAWLKSPAAKWKPFVAHRVAKIQ